ncbi:MAG: formylglycine-generating enzyme family protein [Planctomycetes bacterium]|nr:formylglycine-generating enzyme family protein [Planctomycetota bacterium]
MLFAYFGVATSWTHSKQAFLVQNPNATQCLCACSGASPSAYLFDRRYGPDAVPISLSHPVEQVSWDDCDRILPAVGMRVPTEAQWEYGARGGTTTTWWSGASEDTLDDVANLLDIVGSRAVPQWGQQFCSFSDGFAFIAPVGRFRANSFGLFDIHGNVWEWCADIYERSYSVPVDRDGLRASASESPRIRVNRGGAYDTPAQWVRCARRYASLPSVRSSALGVRACRQLR